MGIELYHLAVVTTSLLVLVVLPFIPVSLVLFREKGWPYIFMVALLLGCSVQAVVGLFWSHFFGKWPKGEVILFGFISLCTMAWVLSRLRAKRQLRFQIGFDNKHIVLVLILFSGFLVRILHPVEVAYLGQSDAYTHLHYLRNIVSSGYLINPAYPPGYHWILSLPVLVFNVDPYWVVRFGGSFFGIGLILAAYVLTEQLYNRRAAIFTSFCVSCFPPMTLLMKTGVGAFANQLGLFLLPCILSFYVHIISDTESDKRPIIYTFAIAFCALVSSVPMMTIHLILIIGFERLLMLFRSPRRWLPNTLLICIISLPAFVTLIFHFSQIGPHQRFQTAKILVEYSEKKQTITEKLVAKAKISTANYDTDTQKLALLIAKSPYMRMTLDFFMFKRSGYGNGYLNSVGLILSCLFCGFLCYGVIKRKISAVIIGLWGGLTSLQAATGILQFSSYQREGWSLLIATCCMGGILAGRVSYSFDRFLIFKAGVGAIMVASFIWTVYSPPQHPMIQSGAEGLIIRSIRFFGQEHNDLIDYCKNKKSPFCQVAITLKLDLPLTLITRRFLGWGNQGEITPNVLPKGSHVETVTVGDRVKNIKFQENRQYIVLIDKIKKLSPKQVVSAFTMVSPKMVTATFRRNNFLIKANKKILRYIENLSRKKWQVNKIALSPYLTAHFVEPLCYANNK